MTELVAGRSWVASRAGRPPNNSWRLPRLLAAQRRDPARDRPRGGGRGRQAVQQDPHEDPQLGHRLPDGVREGAPGQGKVDKDVSPAAVAGSLVVMLAGVASHQKGFTAWGGVKQAELKPNLAQLVHLGITGKKPAK